MFFDIVRTAIHQWTAPPKEKEGPVAPPAKPSKPEGATPVTPKAPEKFVNPYEPNSRYRHLKEEDGSWRKVSKDKDWTPWQPPESAVKTEDAVALYKGAEETIEKIEKNARQTPPLHSLGSWDSAWTEVVSLPISDTTKLKDRLLILHPHWAKVEGAFERIRPDREGEGYGVSSQGDAVRVVEEMDTLARGLAQADFAQFPRFLKKLDWYERKLDDIRKTNKELLDIRRLIEVAEDRHTPKTSKGAERLAGLKEEARSKAAKSLLEDKNIHRARDLAQAQYKRLDKDLKETTFLIERELNATIPRNQVSEAMRQVHAGTYRVGTVTRMRDWFSSRLGGLAGHQDSHSLSELVEKHRDISQKMRDIKGDTLNTANT